MTGIFRANNPLNASILFVYGLLLKLPFFLGGGASVVQQPSDGFLFGKIIWFINPVLNSWPVSAAVITYILLYTQATSINYFINSRKMVPKPNYLVAMSYLLMTSFFPEWNRLSPVLIVSTILVWGMGKLLNLGNTQKVKGTLFNLGFVIGICSFLYLPAVMLLFVVILSLIIMRAPKAAEWAMVLFGFITIWYFLVAGLFLSGNLSGFYMKGLKFDIPEIEFTPLVSIRLGMILLMTMIGIYYLQSEIFKQVIQVRKRWSVILAAAIVMLVTPFLAEIENLTDWLLSLLFLAPLAGIAFYYIGLKWVRFILHWSMAGVIVYFQYFK